MKLTVHNVVIDRGDVMTKPSKQVWDWELALLKEKFPDGCVVVTSTIAVERDELPEAEEEYSRLKSQYGVEGETRQSYVDLVYGRGDFGVKALAKALKAAVEGAVKKSDKADKKADKSSSKASGSDASGAAEDGDSDVTGSSMDGESDTQGKDPLA